jgi:UDP-N-acetylmuramoyl-L-alanyl-D-glutamate--2,6-diaminopimelate ligase
MRPLSHTARRSDELARFLQISNPERGFEFTGLTSNTDLIDAGDLFIALPGKKFHGADFARKAQDRGAVAILSDAEGIARAKCNLPTIEISQPRLLLGDISSWFYGTPFRALTAVGITGTNGKTTTASLLNQLWALSGRESGFIGTIGIEIGKEYYPAQFTTPESSELQATTAAMVERGVTHLVMEVSSHSIAQKRVTGAFFKNVAFTNLTQDHLDFHGTMEEYFSTKAKLFTTEFAEQAFINIDSGYGVRLASMAQLPVHTISRSNTSATWHYSSVTPTSNGFDVSIRGAAGILIEGHTPLIGGHNLDNLLLAVALAVDSGIDPLAIASDLEKLQGPSGRLEKVDIGQKFVALVDYAHTPDAVERVLAAVREVTPGRIIAVLGCGGDRDSSKRPLMGRALADGADLAIFTSDNPRSEKPEAILTDMQSQVEDRNNVIIEVDRRGAIAIAVAEAEAGDLVIILGKGHEEGQEILGVKHPFDDRLELARAIEQLG